MNSTLLITGGQLRENGFDLGEGKYYGAAKLLALDTTSHSVKTLLSIDHGNDNFPDTHPNLEFTVGDVEGNALWLSMDTEIRKYSYPDLQLLCTFSHPCFHNIHSVKVRGDDLWITSTGIDTVVVLDKESGVIKNLLNTDGKAIWHRFNEHTDYRKLHSTRPHDCHPNHIFWLDNKPWVTRCVQEDAVLLENPEMRIDVSGPKRPISIHDGIVRDGYIYFSTVDGSIVIADAISKRTIDVIQLSDLQGYNGLRGWCRGLYFAGDLCYVAFSRLRKTKRIEKLEWVRRILNKDNRVIEECSVICIDLKRRAMIDDFRLPLGEIDAIYSILPEPQGTYPRP